MVFMYFVWLRIFFPCLPNRSCVGALAQDGHLPGYNCTYRSYRGENKVTRLLSAISKGPHVAPHITISVVTAHLAWIWFNDTHSVSVPMSKPIWGSNKFQQMCVFTFSSSRAWMCLRRGAWPSQEYLQEENIKKNETGYQVTICIGTSRCYLVTQPTSCSCMADAMSIFVSSITCCVLEFVMISFKTFLFINVRLYFDR